MATSTQDIITKLKSLGKAGAIDYIKKNADLIKANPELQKEVASIYSQSFGTASTTPTTPQVTPAPVPGATMDTSTGKPYVAPIQGAYDYGAGKSFAPTKTSALGVAYNENATTDAERYGLTNVQKNDLYKYTKKIQDMGLPQAEVSKRASDYMKKLQSENLNSNSFGRSYGSDPENVPSDPTKAKGTIGSLVDLDGDGIPDSQQGYGLEDKPKETTEFNFSDNPWGGEYSFDATNWTDTEKGFAKYYEDQVAYEKEQKEKAAAAYANITNENTKRIIDTNNAAIGSITGLLEEQRQQNEEQYKDAVGSVYRQFGGQVKQFQRIIGSDGRAIDDATALALMGDTGTGAMSKIIDLKNALIQQYLDRKQEAIKQVNLLLKENAITQNDAALGIQAINEKAQVDVMEMTKQFYKQMFGMSESVDNRTQETLANMRTAVSGYFAALGLTPLQQTQLLNNYVKQGYTVNDALQKVAEDIRDQNSPVMKYINDNNKAAASEALAKFNQQMQLKTQPILVQGEVDMQLLLQKQKFEAEQNALDRKVKLAGIGVSKDKTLTYPQIKALNSAFGTVGVSGTVPESLTGPQGLEIITSLTLMSQGENQYAKDILKNKYNINVEDGATAQTVLEKLK